ncbi:MAG: hypothetical protein OEW75_01560 [Cyclobacteriaceae bacterium]|nr:hypothetical protein [Cyclobacteriaceae bacterium]
MKMSILFFQILFLTLASITSYGQQSKDDAINSALLAAPEDKREGATVLGFDESGKTVVLRKGTNELICLADDPSRNGFSVACYHKDLDPFMARGRELRLEGKEFKEIFTIREKEAKEGKFSIPDKATLHIVTGDSFDSQSGTIVNEFKRWVFYLPYATAESTGLPEVPAGPGAPWLMNAGTFAAHIMITPAKN